MTRTPPAKAAIPAEVTKAAVCAAQGVLGNQEIDGYRPTGNQVGWIAATAEAVISEVTPAIWAAATARVEALEMELRAVCAREDEYHGGDDELAATMVPWMDLSDEERARATLVWSEK